MSNRGRLLAIVGPTAAGKSTLAVRVATELGGEVVSADSRQVYRFMDIGTAKATPVQRAAVPHHLIDVVDPDAEYSLALFLRQARVAIEGIHSWSGLPVVAGGTGQYVRSLIEGWQVPEVPPNPGLRRELEARVRTEGMAALYEELSRLDPAAARRVDPRNPRRLIRALEVRGARGDEASAGPSRQAPAFDPVVVGVTLDREALYRRADERVEAMIAAGWVSEVAALLDRGYGVELPSMSSLGYQEITRHLTEGTPLPEAVQRIKSRTHRLIRQQYGWFRLNDGGVRWFEGNARGLDEAASWCRERLAEG